MSVGSHASFSPKSAIPLLVLAQCLSRICFLLPVCSADGSTDARRMIVQPTAHQVVSRTSVHAETEVHLKFNIAQLASSSEASVPSSSGPSSHDGATHRGESDSFGPTSTLVYEVLNRVANHSWEWGTQSQVILEKFYPHLSVFTHTRQLPLSDEDGPLTTPKRLLRLIDPIIARREPESLPIVDGDGSSADPASLGTAVLVAAETTSEEQSRKYQELAEDQLTFLLEFVPQSPDGAISHRESELQYWSDFIYMVPPFLAYSGAYKEDLTLLKVAYDQVRLYRNVLQDNSTGLLRVWRHILRGGFEDPGFWSTGNGWVVGGMMRVYATFLNLRDPLLRDETAAWRADLAEWVCEIVTGAYSFQYPDTHLLPNYFFTSNASHNYAECAGTAMIAAAAYRLATYEPKYRKVLPFAAIEKARIAIFTRFTNPVTGAVAPVVDPLDWGSPTPFNGSQPIAGFVSPEGQAFVLLMHEAWKEFIRSGHVH